MLDETETKYVRELVKSFDKHMAFFLDFQGVFKWQRLDPDLGIKKSVKKKPD